MIRLFLAACFAVFAVSGFTQGTRLPDAASAAEAEVNNSTLAYRTWKDRTGHFSVVARFDKKLSDGRIRLRRKGDEKRIDINPDMLSDEDRAFSASAAVEAAEAEKEKSRAESVKRELMRFLLGIEKLHDAASAYVSSSRSFSDGGDRETSLQRNARYGRTVVSPLVAAIDNHQINWHYRITDVKQDSYRTTISVQDAFEFSLSTEEGGYSWGNNKCPEWVKYATKGDVLRVSMKLECDDKAISSRRRIGSRYIYSGDQTVSKYQIVKIARLARLDPKLLKQAEDMLLELVQQDN